MKNKTQTLSSIAFELLSLLPLEIRCEIEANNQRKDYSFTEKAAIQENLNQEFKKLFTQGRKNSKQKENCQTVGTLKSIGVDRIDDLVGKITNESGETVRKRREVQEAIQEKPAKYSQIVNKVDKGQTSFAYLYSVVKKDQKKPSPPIPDGEFSLVCLDPPWEYYLQLDGSPKYKTMSTDEIKKMKIPMTKDCVVFMWATIPKLKDALQVFEAWGLEYKTAIGWIKKKNGKLQEGTGHYVRGNLELLLIATKGKPGVPLEQNRPVNVIEAERTTHSTKPELAYEIIDRMYPDAKKLEMFARKRRQTGNWVQWGDELEDTMNQI
ncbi:MAG TPA: MT-A70 family methyltransferase [Nitrosopumilaceae archaeon]|nr:MT-A70 family methyltransferase [Nitrosopumilaceae archaeon]